MQSLKTLFSNLIEKKNENYFELTSSVRLQVVVSATQIPLKC